MRRERGAGVVKVGEGECGRVEETKTDRKEKRRKRRREKTNARTNRIRR